MTTPSASKNTEQLEFLHIAGGDVKWYSYLWKRLAISDRVKLPYILAISLLGVYLGEIKTYVL